MNPTHGHFTTLIALLLVAFSGSAFAQINDYCHTIEGVKGTSVSVDPNGNVYVIDGSTLYKYARNGNELFPYQYSNFQLGDIASVDVDNPLKIMLFYQDEGMILFLDEKMNPLMEPLNLMEAGLNNISLATYSTDNTIWLYDVVLHDLINVNFQLKELSRNHLSIEKFEPTQFISLKEKKLAMYNPATGIVFFDAFGTYLKTIPVRTDAGWCQVDEKCIYFLKYDYLGLGEDKSWLFYQYNYTTLKEELVGDLTCSFEKFAYHNGSIWAIDDQHRLKLTIPIPAE